MNYARIYDEFIADRRLKEPACYRGLALYARRRLGAMAGGVYVEHHHIKPLCAGGVNCAENIISLVPEDHIRGHLLLAYAYGGPNNWAAVKFIYGNAKHRGRVPSRRETRIAAKAREAFGRSNSGPNNPNYGKPVSAARRAVLREASLGKTHSKEARAKISAAHRGNTYAKGFKHSPETIAKVRAANLGRTHSEATKAKMSASGMGRVFSTEHCAAISKSRTGITLPPRTDSHRAALSKAMRGRTFTQESRAKMSASRMGKTASAATREKMSQSQTGGGNTRAKPVFHLNYGVAYSCVKDAAVALGLTQSSLRAALNRGGGYCTLKGHDFTVL